MEQFRISINVQRVIVGPSVRCKNRYARSGTQNAGILQQILHGNAGVLSVKISRPCGIHEHKLGVLRHGFQLRFGINAAGGRHLGWVVIRITGVSNRCNLCGIAVSIPIRILVRNGNDRTLVSAIYKIVRPIGIQGVHNITAAIISIAVMTPLATSETDHFSRFFFILTPGMTESAMVQLCTRLIRILRHKMLRIILPFMMVGG